MIREMKVEDWNKVADIYTQGMERGKSTFNTQCPSYDEWDKGHAKDCRFVYVIENQIVGWAAVSPSSSRCAYRGCVEASIYIDEKYQGMGIGTKLLNKLCEATEQAGYWSVLSNIFSINEASIALHKKCGFREVGYREKIAKDRFGEWQNTTIMERRSAII